MSSPRRGRQQQEDTIAEIELVEHYVYDRCMNLEYRLNSRLKSEMMVDLGLTKNRLVYIINLIRKKRGITSLKKVIRSQKCNVIQKHLIKKGFIRKSQRETAACDLIIELLNNLYHDIKIVRRGIGLYIGTQTPLCASENPKNDKKIDDNLEVFWALKWSTKSPVTMIVGDAVSSRKAQDKVDAWRSHSSVPSNTRIFAAKVDKDTFVQHTRELLRRVEPDRLVKVVLLTSGSWSNSNNKGIDCNYESIAIPLTCEYPNLHIFAMTREKNDFGFDVRWIHRGAEKIWRAGKVISNIDRRCEFPEERKTY